MYPACVMDFCCVRLCAMLNLPVSVEQGGWLADTAVGRPYRVNFSRIALDNVGGK